MNRGAEWHRWEPHIHVPGTVLGDAYQDRWDLYLNELEASSPPFRAIGVTDYCITRSYERLKAMKDEGRLKDCDLLFPNVELRLNTGTVKGNFVNIHLLVNPEDPDHITELNRFLGRLSFSAFNDEFTCTPEDLARLGRRAQPEALDDEAALRHGCSQFKASLDNLLDAYRNIEWAHDNILIAVSGNADGSSGVKVAADATLRQEIEKAAHVIFASSSKQRKFWLGDGKIESSELRERYDGPKPCLWGSDAHDLLRVGKPAENRFCWIKGAPTFDALRQACIDPERAYIGSAPPSPGTVSQIIDQVCVEGASWLKTPTLRLNSGLVAVIGARGSGKTALVDMIAAGCDSYVESEERPSFLARAREHLSTSVVSLAWLSKDTTSCSLDNPANESPEAYPRARYLSQQFVEELCSFDGMPALIAEIERVIFEAHPSLDRDGAVDFEEFLNLRASQYRNARTHEEDALATLCDQIGLEIDKVRQVETLKAQINEKTKQVAGYQLDRTNLLPKDSNKTGARLEALMAAAEKVRSYIRYFVNQHASLVHLGQEVQDLRRNKAPGVLQSMKERYQQIGLDETSWNSFLLKYSGDVDGIMSTRSGEAEKLARLWKGTPPTADDCGAFLSETADLDKTPLAILEAEIGRLEKLVTADKEAANKLAVLSKRIADETTALERLKEKLADYEGAAERAAQLTKDREDSYVRVFDAIISEERVLKDLYAPLMNRLRESDGTVTKLSFTVRRVANVAKWANRGEDELFDLRGGPFKGIGSLERQANAMLKTAWTSGTAEAVSKAMSEFRAKHENELIARAPYPRTDKSNFRAWSRRFAQWLYSTEHISIEYEIRYDGINVQKLSPGTRGIVLLLLYLALDSTDDRPLIIDQPEENLDPKSVYDELVPLFLEAKRKRQVIMVTHNANLVVNTDADQIIVADVGTHTTGGLPPITYRSGGLDEAPIRKMVCDTLEGGELAFKARARRLRILFER